MWGNLPDNVFFEGTVPENYQLFVCPGKYIVLDIDVDEKNNKNGFENVPMLIQEEIDKSYNYFTKREGKHYWLLYTGNKVLANKTSGFSIDLRVGQKPGNAGGYVVYYPDNDIRNQTDLINETSVRLNTWLEKLFSYK